MQLIQFSKVPFLVKFESKMKFEATGVFHQILLATASALIRVLAAASLSFLILDLVILPIDPIEPSIGGKVNLLSIFSTTFTLAFISTLFARHNPTYLRFLRRLTNILVHSLMFCALLLIDRTWFFDLSGYFEVVLAFQATTLLLVNILERHKSAKLPFSIFGGFLALYLSLLYLLPAQIALKHSPIAGDWLKLSHLQAAIASGASIQQIVADPNLFQSQPTGYSSQTKMLGLPMRFFPEAILHFSKGKITAYNLNWKHYD